MKRPNWQLAGLVLAAALPAVSAFAQIEGMLGKAGKHPDLKGMAGMASTPLASGSMSNVAGLLQYCIGNGQLSAQGAGPVKDKLMAKLPGAAKTEDRGYTDGLKGLLHGSNGNLVDLSSGGGLAGSAGVGAGADSSAGSTGSTGSMGSMGAGGSTGSTGSGTSADAGAGTGGLTANLTKKACDTILAQAKSFL